jgi:hypothetical protein
MKAAALIIVTLLLGVHEYGQTSPTLCPRLVLALPDELLIPERPISISAKIEGRSPDSGLEYFWMSSGGKINRQGESAITLTANDEDNGGRLAVALKVIGFPTSCQDTVSGFVWVAPLPIGEPFEILGRLSLNDYKSRIDNYFFLLNQNPSSEGVIEFVFDKKDTRLYKRTLLKNIDEFIGFRKYDKHRVTFAVAEGNSQLSVLWIVPPGAKYPYSSIRSGSHLDDGSYQLIKGEELNGVINDICLRNGRK